MESSSTSYDRRQRLCVAFMLALIMALLLSLGARLIHINTKLRPGLLSYASRQYQGRARIPARRGMVLDTKGRIIALSRQVPDVFVDPTLLKDVDRLAEALSPRLNRSAGEIAGLIRRGPRSRYKVIARGVDDVTAHAIGELRNPAVGLTDRAKRFYPMGSSAAHLIGWVGRDGDGLEGIELTYQSHLRGHDGRRGTIRDARRRALWRDVPASVSATDGGHVVLTIDSEIQRILERALEEGTKRVDAHSGVAVVMVPHTGDILAMACWPSFDPNESFLKKDRALRRNRVITDPVEPGSTFKPFIACSALDGGFITLTEKIDCHNGVHRFGRRVIKDTRRCGLLDIRGIVVNSSNIGMAQVAERMGNTALYETLQRFGFGTPTGIEILGENPGLVYPLHKWGTMTTTSIPMGYEVLVTPLQLITAFSSIINDGLLLKPRLVKALLRPDGTVAESFDGPEIVRRTVSTSVARRLREDILPGVVEQGGGGKAKPSRWRALGKTGTAKLVDPKTKLYEPGAYLGLFIGAAPVENPAITVLVMIRRPDPQKAYYGGAIAAPVAREVFESVLRYLGVPPSVAQVATKL